MRPGTIRAGLLTALMSLLAVLLPAGAAQAAVTCPSAAAGESLNIVTSGGVTTCTNIGMAKATEGIEIFNALGDTGHNVHTSGWGYLRFGISFRRVTPAANEQPTALGCAGACWPLGDPNGGQEPFDEDVVFGTYNSLTQIQTYDWLFGNGVVSLATCFTALGAQPNGCEIPFRFSDGTAGSFAVAAGSTTISSFSVDGGTPLLSVVSGSGQAVGINRMFASPLKLKLLSHPTLAPLVGRSVIFSRPATYAASAHLSPSSGGGDGTVFVTDANGEISLRADATAVAGSYAIKASAAGGNEVSFNLTNIGPHSFTFATGSTPQSVGINTDFAVPIGGQVKDNNGNPSAGVGITFRGPASGPTAFLYEAGGTNGVASTVTDTDGRFSLRTRANGLTGSYMIHAAVPGIGTFSYALTNTLHLQQTIAFTSTVPTLPAPGTTYTVAATGGASGNPVTYGIDAASGSGVCTISGATVSFAAPGACIVNADQAGNGNYLAAARQQQSITVAKIAQAITFTSAVPANPVVGSTYAVTATGGASGLPVTFAIDAASAAGACSISGATVSFTGSGICIVNANQAGNANYNAAPQVQQSMTAGVGSQTIAFTSTPPSPASVGTPYTVTATGGASGNPVTFAIDGASTTGACTASGSTVSFAGAGSCIINANQAGNANYSAAAQVQQTVSVVKRAQTTAFTKPADQTFGAAPAALDAKATSGLTVSFASTTPGVCTVAGATATIVGAGSCSITASQAGDTTWLAAPDVVQTFAVGKAPQTISFTKPADVIFAPGTSVALTASASSGLAVTLASQTTGVCTVSGTTATLVAAGTCTIKASQVGNANFLAAPDVTVSFGAFAPPTISATATVSPSSFSKPGTMLVFTFTLTNAGGVAATGLVLRDTRLGVLICAATSIAAGGGTTTCTGSTASTAADLAARGITITPQVTYSYSVPAPAISASARSGALAAPSASAASTTVTISLNVTVTAGVDVAAVQQATKSAIQSFMSQRGNLITTSGPDTARAHARLGGGTLFGGSGSGNAPATGFADDERGLARPRTGLGALGRHGSMLGYDGSRDSGVSIGGGLGGGNTSFSNGGKDGPLSGFGRTPRGPMAFAFGREANTAGGPLGAPFGWQREYPDAANDNARPGLSAFRFSGNAQDGMGRFAFATSLAQMRAAAEAQDQAKRASVGFSPSGVPAPGLEGSAIDASPGTPTPRAAGLGLGAGQGLAAPASSAGRPGSVDIWVEGSSSYFTTNRIDGRRQGHAAIAHVGIDMIVAPGLLVGVMGSYDWMAESASTPGGNRDGRGWMAGPYMSARLTQNLFFDARYAWGQSTNHIDPLGAYVDTFSTTRQLASAKLTGDWSLDAWRFRPSAEVIWFTETQKAYVNQIGIDIAANTFSLGRTMFGPEVGYRLMLSDKSVLEPFVGFKGVWDFAHTQQTTAAGTPIGHDGLRGRVEAGLSYRAPNGITVRGSGSYDGIGSDGYRAVQGQARLVVPLQ